MLRPRNFFTMLLQILGQFYFAIEIITKVYSDVYCDTTGLPFTYFILKYLGHAKVTTYTHYPFISKDMIYQVQNNKPGVHSRGNLSKNHYIRKIKSYYYRIILKLYKIMGNKCISFAYVNSTWTYNHMKEIWDDLYKSNKLFILYPPCSISLYKEAAKNNDRQNIIVSFAQFRPEKNQRMQIRILSTLKKKLGVYPGLDDLELHLIGGVRNPDDQKIFDDLNNYARQLGVQQYVKFLKNGTTEQITEEFSKAKIGIHTMIDEHFGITLIEMMAAGLIVVTHNSAGAKNDILINEGESKPGFLVNNENEYVAQIEEILIRYNEIKGQMISCSTQRAEKFSDEAFKEKFLIRLKEFLI
jgi:alpha-1,2-mannosyltransferase